MLGSGPRAPTASPKWLLPVIRAQLARDGEIRRSVLVVEAWVRYAEGIDEKGQPIEVVDGRRDEVMARARAQSEDSLAFLRDPSLSFSVTWWTNHDSPRPTSKPCACSTRSRSPRHRGGLVVTAKGPPAAGDRQVESHPVNRICLGSGGVAGRHRVSSRRGDAGGVRRRQCRQRGRRTGPPRATRRGSRRPSPTTPTEQWWPTTSAPRGVELANDPRAVGRTATAAATIGTDGAAYEFDLAWQLNPVPLDPPPVVVHTCSQVVRAADVAGLLSAAAHERHRDLRHQRAPRHHRNRPEPHRPCRAGRQPCRPRARQRRRPGPRSAGARRHGGGDAPAGPGPERGRGDPAVRTA